MGQDTVGSSDAGATTKNQGEPSSSTPSPGGRAISVLPPVLPPADSTMQVASPSVTLPAPDLPKPPPLPSWTPEPQPQASPPLPVVPVFNPPSAENLNLQSGQPAGNPQFAPASVGMPSIRLDDMALGEERAASGLLSNWFDWANKFLFQAAARAGYDSNVNQTHNNTVGSMYGNLNGAVSYRFGAPRLVIKANLTGGLTWYSNTKLSSSEQNQGVIGLGLSVEYRYSPRLVLTYNTSSSFQQQANPSLAGSAQNSNGSYIYTANSFAAAYQVSDVFSTITRFNFTANYYLQNSLNNQSGFSQPGFTESFRWLVKPTTTAVVDYSTDLYGYIQQGNSSWGQVLDVGFDHTFNPEWFWNFRLGAEYRTYQNSVTGTGSYVGPYVDSNFNWALGKRSSLSWVAHLGTQPSGQQNVSYSAAFRTGLNYNQQLFSRLRFDAGFFYLIQNYKDNPNGPATPAYPNGSPISYNQTFMQGNVDLIYDLNRVFQLAIGYQYLTSICSAVPSQGYDRGISYIQLKAAF